jgi:hypothetical protein
VVEEEPEDDADAGMYMDADLENEDDSWGDEERYDEYEELYGLPAGDILEEEMERELAEFGMSHIVPFQSLNSWCRSPAEELSEEDMAILRAFALKTEDNLTNATFAKLPYISPTRTFPL